MHCAADASRLLTRRRDWRRPRVLSPARLACAWSAAASTRPHRPRRSSAQRVATTRQRVAGVPRDPRCTSRLLSEQGCLSHKTGNAQSARNSRLVGLDSPWITTTRRELSAGCCAVAATRRSDCCAMTLRLCRRHSRTSRSPRGSRLPLRESVHAAHPVEKFSWSACPCLTEGDPSG